MADNYKNFFTEIYIQNIWADAKSRSGTGSNLSETGVIRHSLPKLLSRLNVKIILDIPCGDFFWMKDIQSELRAQITEYRGGDIVDEMIKTNQANYSDNVFKFSVYDIQISELPKADLIFCRDCLVHFSYHDILKTLVNLKKSRSTYLLATTFPNWHNRNIITGAWRPLNLQAFPFFFSQPEQIIIENSTEFSEYRDKSLGLWQMKEISIFKARIGVGCYSCLSKLKKLIIWGIEFIRNLI